MKSGDPGKAQRLEPERGPRPGRGGIVGTGGEAPGIAFGGERGRRPADDHGNLRALDVGGEGLDFRAADGADDRRDVAALGQALEGRDRTAICRLVILDLQFDRTAIKAAVRVDLADAPLGALYLE